MRRLKSGILDRDRLTNDIYGYSEVACTERSNGSCKPKEFIATFVEGTILYSRDDGLMSTSEMEI